MAGREEGEHQGGQAGSQTQVALWEMAEAPDVPWGGAREGERSRVPGTWR